jgi:asparagine synthetase B (glutamine-hydrolysing)
VGAGDRPRPPSRPGAAAEAVAAWESAVAGRRGPPTAAGPGLRPRIEGDLAAELELYLSHLLNRQDKCTMAASVETRVPFLDPDVIALALNLPLEARVEPRRKGVLRDVARRLLGDDIADRPEARVRLSEPRDHRGTGRSRVPARRTPARGARDAPPLSGPRG